MIGPCRDVLFHSGARTSSSQPGPRLVICLLVELVVCLLVGLVIVVGIYRGETATGRDRDAATPSAAPGPEVRKDPPPSSRNPWSDLARETLMRQCGRCHRRDLPTAVPAALTVFDLLDNPWDSRLRVDQLYLLLVRVRAVDNLPPPELEAVEKFVRCARDGACGAKDGRRTLAALAAERAFRGGPWPWPRGYWRR